MSGVKYVVDLLKKGAPQVKKLAQTIGDVRSDVLTKNQLFKQTKMNTSQLREYFNLVGAKGDKALDRGKRIADRTESVQRHRLAVRSSPAVEQVQHRGDIVYHDVNKALDDVKAFDTRIAARAIAKTLPKKSNLRNVVADRLNTERRQGREFNELVRRFGELERREGNYSESFVSRLEQRRALDSAMSPRFRQTMDDIVERHTNVPERHFGSRMPTPRIDMDLIHEQAEEARRVRAAAEEALLRSENLVSEAENVLNRVHPTQRSRNQFDYGVTESRENATEEGFAEYIRRKYGREPTRGE